MGSYSSFELERPESGSGGQIEGVFMLLCSVKLIGDLSSAYLEPLFGAFLHSDCVYGMVLDV